MKHKIYFNFNASNYIPKMSAGKFWLIRHLFSQMSTPWLKVILKMSTCNFLMLLKPRIYIVLLYKSLLKLSCCIKYHDIAVQNDEKYNFLILLKCGSFRNLVVSTYVGTFRTYSETFRTNRFIMVRCFIPIYFCGNFFCIHSDKIINVTTKFEQFIEKTLRHI